MKKLLVICGLLSLTTPLLGDEIDNYKKNTQAIWRTGSGAEDGTYTAIATSMLGWGVGLSALFGIVASVLHQSNVSHSTTHCD